MFFEKLGAFAVMAWAGADTAAAYFVSGMALRRTVSDLAPRRPACSPHATPVTPLASLISAHLTRQAKSTPPARRIDCASQLERLRAASREADRAAARALGLHAEAVSGLERVTRDIEEIRAALAPVRLR